MLLYHINAGFPVIDQGARLLEAVRRVTPRDADAQEGADHFACFSSPVPAYREQVFFHEMIAAPDGYVRAGLVNTQGFGFYVRYRQRELPCFNEWKMMGEGVYAVGMEPATNWVTGRAKERERGALQLLQPGEQRQYHLEFGLLTGPDEAAEMEQQLSSLAKG